MKQDEKTIEKRTKGEFIDYVFERLTNEILIDLTFWDDSSDKGETFAIISCDLFANGLSKDHIPEMISFGSYDRDCTTVLLPHESKDKIKEFLCNCLNQCKGDFIFTSLTV